MRCSQVDIKDMIKSKSLMEAEVIGYLAQGNPGCIAFLNELAEHTGQYFAKYANILKVKRLTGSRAYMIWNDACARNIEETVELLRDIGTGRLSMRVVDNHMATGRCFPFSPEEYEPYEPISVFDKQLYEFERQAMNDDRRVGHADDVGMDLHRANGPENHDNCGDKACCD